MAAPSYTDMLEPFLIAICDGREHDIEEIMGSVATRMGLTKEDLAEDSAGGTVNRYRSNIGQTKISLCRAGLLTFPERKNCGIRITDEGWAALVSGRRIDFDFLMQYPSFVRYESMRHHPKGWKPERRPAAPPQMRTLRSFSPVSA